MRTDFENAIVAMVTDSWAMFTDGEVESPTGHFGVVEIDGFERVEQYTTDDANLDAAIYSAKIGYYFFVEDNYGNVSVEYFPVREDAASKFAQYSESYSAWLGE